LVNSDYLAARTRRLSEIKKKKKKKTEYLSSIRLRRNIHYSMFLSFFYGLTCRSAASGWADTRNLTPETQSQ
jgi:hypothetical protein